MAYITGYYGCSCHPFNSWAECDKYHKQKFNVGDKVHNRHSNTDGEVIEKTNSKGFCIVKYGPFRRDEHLEHVASLEKIEPQLSLFKQL